MPTVLVHRDPVAAGVLIGADRGQLADHLLISHFNVDPLTSAITRHSHAWTAPAGPMVGYEVEYWMDIKPTKIADVTGQDGYATRTIAVTLAGQKAYIMTVQKGEPPKVIQDGDRVTIGGQTITFDGKKIMLTP